MLVGAAKLTWRSMNCKIRKGKKNHKVVSIICCFVGHNLDLEEQMILKNIKGRKYLL